jgi:cytochrome c peroxidase
MRNSIDKRKRRLFLLIALVFGAGISVLTVSPVTESQEQSQVSSMILPSIVPAPADNPTTPDKVALGKQLFFDPRLSGNNTVSCASCHLPEKAFADGLPKGKGVGRKQLSHNTPSLLNTGFYTSYFWDGRARSLEEQALFPIQSSEEMNQDLTELEKELDAIPGYVAQFRSVFGTSATRGLIAKALAAFQRTIVSRNSPFDRYLAGDKSSLSEEAKQGWELFKGDAGCIRCHSGPGFTDGKFYRLGTTFTDKGRGAVTGDKRDFYAFRTPGLRDVARTAPYLHDGSLETLTQVVEFYYRGVPTGSADGLPLDVTPLLGQSYSEISAIVAFLESLNGELPQVSRPALP